MNTPSFSFQIEVLDQHGRIRIDVYAHDLPANFLGTAFTLDMNAHGWKYQKYELASVLGPKEDVLSLAVKKNNPERIIFGVSLKRGFMLQTLNGKLMSFYVKLTDQDFKAFKASQTTLFQLHFGQGVVSVFQGGRQDLSGVFWQDGVFSFFKGVSKSVSQKTTTPKKTSKPIASSPKVTTSPASTALQPSSDKVSLPLSASKFGPGTEEFSVSSAMSEGKISEPSFSQNFAMDTSSDNSSGFQTTSGVPFHAASVVDGDRSTLSLAADFTIFFAFLLVIFFMLLIVIGFKICKKYWKKIPNNHVSS